VTSAPVSELDLPLEMLESDESINPLRDYSEKPDIVVIVTDPELYYELMGIPF